MGGEWWLCCEREELVGEERESDRGAVVRRLGDAVSELRAELRPPMSPLPHIYTVVLKHCQSCSCPQ